MPVPPLAFGDAEFAIRLSRTRRLMQERTIDALLVFAPHNYYYLTGFQSGLSHSLTTLIVPLHGDVTWVTRKTELSNIVDVLGNAAVCHGVADDQDHVTVLAEVLESLGLGRARLGIDKNALYFNISHGEQLARILPSAERLDGSQLVEQLRRQKSDAELAYMRRAGAITARALEAGFADLHEGKTDTELAISIMSQAFLLGSERMGMLPFVAFGPRTAKAHATWIGAPLQRGEVINAEAAAAVARYHVPVFRVASLGAPSAEIAKMHEASKAGLMEGLAKIKAGMTSGEADALMRAPIERAGHGAQFVVRAGYSIGIGFAPSWGEGNTLAAIKPSSPDLLLPGMTFHLVPALYQSGVGCVCCSMPVAVTESGVEALAPIEPELFIR